MKSIKIFFLATVAIVAGLFTACSDDDFKAGPEVDGADGDSRQKEYFYTFRSTSPRM